MLIVKIGGGMAINKNTIAKDIKSLKQKVVFVHGGRIQADKLAQKLGHPTQRITSPSGMTSTYTDSQALDILTMTYAGLLNKQWVAAFQSAGINAVGLSGADGRIWQGNRKQHLIAIGNNKQKLISNTFTGKVTRVNVDLINILLKSKYLPVITQPAITRNGELINTDNDRNLAVMAGALKVKTLVVLFEAPGLLKDPSDPSTLISKINKKELKKIMVHAQGTMKKKVLGAIEAFENGVAAIYWGDARIKNPVSSALAGKGTIIL